jgi:hypothetical protein
MLEPIRDSRGQVIGFVEPNGNSTNVYHASDGRQIADNPAAIGLLLEGGT